MTPQEWQRKACGEVGSIAGNAVFELALPLSTQSGTYTISVNGDETAPLSPYAADYVVQSALETLEVLGAGNVLVSGLKKGPYLIELIGELAGQAVPENYITADGTGLNGSPLLTPQLVQQGVSSRLALSAAQFWEDYSSYSDGERFLRVKIDLVRAELGRASQQVDERDGDAEAKNSQRVAALKSVLADAQRELTDLQTKTVSSSRLNTYAGKIKKTTPNGLPFGRVR